MSNEHKRWNPQLEQYYKGVNKTPSYRPKMMLDITGRYVLESDYAALINRIEELEANLEEAVGSLEKLARLGNGDLYGNSDGNMIARITLAKLKGEK